MTILNKLGMHARPSARFVKVSNRYKAEIWVEKDGEQVNGKSIMGLDDAGGRAGLQAARHGRGAGRGEKAIEDLEQLVQTRISTRSEPPPARFHRT